MEMYAYQNEQARPAQPQRVKFHATGGEYFRIWIVNLLLTIVTLGIYSAWAKVRRNQYFYANTELAGASFEYHGNPRAILKGRIVAALMAGAYGLAGHYSPKGGVVVALVLAGLSPWLILRSLQFRLYNTSYRGIRFIFAGQTRDAYTVYLWRPIMNGFTLMLATPFVYQRMKAWQHGESRFGTARFSFDATVGSFYNLYAAFMLVLVGCTGLLGVLIFSGPVAASVAANTAMAGQAKMGFMLLGVYALLFALYPFFTSFLQKLVWNHTRLEQHQFSSDMRLGRLAFITLTNYLAIICTLGLFLPFAKVRAMRYQLESMSLQPQGSLDDFVAASGAPVGAFGEGMADVLDFDFSL